MQRDTSHVDPVQPAGHSQVNASRLDQTHVPPFKHGSERQGSTGSGVWIGLVSGVGIGLYAVLGTGVGAGDRSGVRNGVLTGSEDRRGVSNGVASGVAGGLSGTVSVADLMAGETDGVKGLRHTVMVVSDIDREAVTDDVPVAE
eukprot:gene5704-biopygen4930